MSTITSVDEGAAGDGGTNVPPTLIELGSEINEFWSAINSGKVYEW